MPLNVRAWVAFKALYLFPAIWIVGFGFGTVVLWTSGDAMTINDNGVVREITRTDQIEFSVMFVAGTIFCALLFGPRRIALEEEEALRVYFGPFHLVLPYDHVYSVERGRWMFSDALLVRFSRPGPFLLQAAVPLDSDGRVGGMLAADFRAELLRRSVAAG